VEPTTCDGTNAVGGVTWEFMGVTTQPSGTTSVAPTHATVKCVKDVDGFPWQYVVGGTRIGATATSTPYTPSQTVWDVTKSLFGQGIGFATDRLTLGVGTGGTHIDVALANNTAPTSGTKGSWGINYNPAAGGIPFWVATATDTFAPAVPLPLYGSATWDPGNLASGSSQTTTVTVTGAALGDYAIVSFSLSLSGTAMVGYVSASNTVTVVHSNLTGAPVDLSSGTLRAMVIKTS
jgi:hypothetical protein